MGIEPTASRVRFGDAGQNGRESSGACAIAVDGSTTVLTLADSPLTVAVRILRALAEAARAEGDSTTARKLEGAVAIVSAD